jgi:hypothetical protein
MKNLFMALLDVANRFGDITSANMYDETHSNIEIEADGKTVKFFVTVVDKQGKKK